MEISLRQRCRPWVILMLWGLVAGCAVMAVSYGAVAIPLSDLWKVIWGKVMAGTADHGHQFEAIIWHLRVPRVIAGGLVGATLAVSGVLMQGLFRNPLAEPGLVGVSAGAAMGAVLVIVLAGSLFPHVGWLGDMRVLPFASFIGALGVTLTIQRLASSGGYTAVATLLLAGVAMNAVVAAGVAFTGMIAFVGLIVPHMVRAVVGPDHRWLLSGSAAFGAAVMIAADTVARTWVAPAELPIGVLTALIGGPFFMVMFLAGRRRVLWG